ncbi:MAG TPA: VOC family protein [Vicinamibacterales bacterium]|nr:VOC family protein [Vicinamibacterales bacterium]
METIIASLLKDFEDGKMNRRQLIKSLAVAAVAATGSATVGAQTLTPAAPAAPWKTVWLDHISFGVADYKRSAAFYKDVMGWEIRSDNGTSQATLDIGNIGSIIIRNRRQPQPDAAAAAPAGRAPITGVVDHISFGVEPWNTEAVEAELKRKGLAPRPDMVGETFKSWHVKDPDGWDLQISNKTSNRRDS